MGESPTRSGISQVAVQDKWGRDLFTVHNNGERSDFIADATSPNVIENNTDGRRLIRPEDARDGVLRHNVGGR